eukprot:1141964-Pelagomonas_calceolata.AAC.7
MHAAGPGLRSLFFSVFLEYLERDRRASLYVMYAFGGSQREALSCTQPNSKLQSFCLSFFNARAGMLRFCCASRSSLSVSVLTKPAP